MFHPYISIMRHFLTVAHAHMLWHTKISNTQDKDNIIRCANMYAKSTVRD